MFTEMHCGACDSFFQIDSEEEEAVWLFVHRFTEAHVACGYITTSAQEDAPTFSKKMIRPRLEPESEET